MPTVWEIIRRRWPEALLIVVLYAGMFVVFNQMLYLIRPVSEDAERYSIENGFLLGFGVISIGVLLLLLHLGFIVTSMSDGTSSREPVDLIKAGRHYFWRIFRSLFLIDLVLNVVMLLVLYAIGPWFVDMEQAQELPMWILGIGKFISLILMFKLIIIIPSVMVSHNKMVIESLPYIMQYRLSHLRGIFPHYILWAAARSVPLIIMELVTRRGIGEYVILGICGLVFGFEMFVVYYKAVRLFAPERRESVEQRRLGPRDRDRLNNEQQDF